MPKLSPTAIPAYRRHKASGQAIVTLNGQDFYLGSWKSAASRSEYARVTGEWLSAGRRLLSDPSAVTVAEIVDAFRTFCLTYYRFADGKLSREINNIDEAIAPLLKLYGRNKAIEFGPLALKVVRDAMIAANLARTNINRRISRVRYVFKWATENELLPSSVFHALQAVSGLRFGRCEARESDPVKPVPEHVLSATLDKLSPYLQAMVKLQLITGMRPGELCSMTTADIDTGGGRVWTYKPLQHKTRHHGHVREIRIGPKAQEILRPFLKPNLQAIIFSPIDAEAQRREQQRAERKTPLTPSQIKRAECARKRKRLRAPEDHYTVHSYRRAICRAAEKAEVTSWHPHQLRHNFATNIRRDYGPEAALVLLGDKSTKMIDVYADRDRKSADSIVAKIG